MEFNLCAGRWYWCFFEVETKKELTEKQFVELDESGTLEIEWPEELYGREDVKLQFVRIR